MSSKDFQNTRYNLMVWGADKKMKKLILILLGMIMMVGVYVSPAVAESTSLTGDSVFLQIKESVTDAIFREVTTAFADKYKPSLLHNVTAGDATV